MSIMPWVNDDVLNLAFEATIMAALVVVVCVTAASEVIRLWRWRSDVLYGLLKPHSARTTEGEAALLATACGALIICSTLVVVPATTAIIEHVRAAISENAAQAEENRERR